jgi:sigma-B regulation protein RsbU (phosphoserine phosphatase)
MWDDLVATEAFITLFVGRYEPSTQQLHYVNAGHQPALLSRADDTTEELDSDGMPLGILAAPTFEEKVSQLGPGDLLLIFSDGVVEASSPAGVEFGTQGLRALLTADGRHSAEDTVANVLGHLADFRVDGTQDDDITIVGLHVASANDPGGRR